MLSPFFEKNWTDKLQISEPHTDLDLPCNLFMFIHLCFSIVTAQEKYPRCCHKINDTVVFILQLHHGLSWGI